MRDDCLVAQRRHEISTVVTLVGTQRDRSTGLGLDQRQRRPPLGMARSGCGHRADNQTVAVLHQRVPHEAQPRFLCDRGGRRGRLSRHACHCGAARRENPARYCGLGREDRPSRLFARKLFRLAQASG